MKGMSLWQPWATLVAIGAKSIETRSWSTPYRGWLAIHATKTDPAEARDFARTPLVQRTLSERGFMQDLPRGAIVAVANLHRVGRISRRQNGVYVAGLDLSLSEEEVAFGDYADGRFGWSLTNVRALPEPIPCRGAQSLWDVPADVVARIDAQVTR